MRSQDIAMNGPILLENAHKMAIDLGAEFDNATCQKLDKNFTSIQIVFLPPNTPSLIQPLDQSIIRTNEVYFGTQLITKMVIAIHNGVGPVVFARSISISKNSFHAKESSFSVETRNNS